MTKAQCLALRAHAVRASGLPNATALHDAVIAKGFLGCAMTRDAFTWAQACYHLAQSLEWGAHSTGAERRQWVATAHRRAFLMWCGGFGSPATA